MVDGCKCAKGCDRLSVVSKVVERREIGMSRKAILRKFAAKVSDKYGTGTVGIGVGISEIPRIKTRSLALDVALGGGIPVGRTVMFYGEKSSGKSTTAYRIAGVSQKLCANCLRPTETEVVEDIDETTGEVEVCQIGHCDCYELGLFTPTRYPSEKNADWTARLAGYKENSYEEFRVALIDIEASFDKTWAEKLGLDDRLVVYVRPDTAEEAIDIYDSLLRTGSVDMFILDSIAAMTPSKEVEESVEKWQQGLQARLVNKFVRKVQASSNSVAREYGRLVTQIWINQVREKIGVMFGDPTTTPGGKGQGFATSVEVKMWSSQYNKESLAELAGKEKSMEIASDVRINFRCEKNKTAPPKATGSYVMELATGAVMQDALLTSLAERFGVLRKESATKWMLGDDLHKTKTAAVDSLLGENRSYYEDAFRDRLMMGVV